MARRIAHAERTDELASGRGEVAVYAGLWPVPCGSDTA
jgi:hypothetical protein